MLKFEQDASIVVMSEAILSLQRLQIVESPDQRTLSTSTIILENASLELYVSQNILLMDNYPSRESC